MGALRTHIAVFEGKKSPCGSAKDENRSFWVFEGKKKPAGTLKTRICIFEGKKPLRER